MSERAERVVCPDCKGVPQAQGDGSGWDGGGTYHTPPCPTCHDEGIVRHGLTKSESGYVIVLRLLLDESVTEQDAEAIAEGIFEPAFEKDEVVAGGWDLEPAEAADR